MVFLFQLTPEKVLTIDYEPIVQDSPNFLYKRPEIDIISEKGNNK